MSTTTAFTERSAIQASKPSFFGIVGGEIFKATRMWSFWITLVLLLGFVCFPPLITMAVRSSQGAALKQDALQFFYGSVQQDLFVVRVFIGMFLLVLTASVFGREYQLGTIRILLARGVGRLQLLFAKLLAVIVMALLVFALCLLLTVALQCIQTLVLAGNLDSLKALNSDFWSNIGTYLLTILISMGETILLAVALTAIGRSFVFGLSASIAFYPVDNIGSVFMRLGYLLTQNDFWKNVTAYFPGLNLNEMPAAIVPDHFRNYGAGPLVQVDGTHTLLVTLVASLLFAIVAIVLTWRRDVKE